MPKNQGMLFLFDQPGWYSFWMQGMRFPLDIVFLNNGKVMDVASDLPPPSSLSIPAAYIPKAPANQVIELNAGQAQALGWRPGVVIPELVK